MIPDHSNDQAILSHIIPLSRYLYICTDNLISDHSFIQAMNQLSAETTVDARSFMVYVERPEEEVKGEIIFMIIIIFVIVDIFKSIILVEHQNKENSHITVMAHII